MGGGEKFRQLRRVAAVRSVLVGTAAAFTGGALVLALQAVFALVSVRYPPIMQGLHCNFAPPPVRSERKRYRRKSHRG
jgi:hypothetical protein